MRILRPLCLIACVLALVASCSIDKVTFFNQDAGPEIDAPIDGPPIDTVDAGPTRLMVSTDDMTIPEGGQSLLILSLTGPPTDATLVTVMSGNDAKVGVVPNYILFSPTNWMTPQVVMVTGKEDANVSDEQVNVAVVSSVLNAILSVTVRVTDNDGLSIVTTPSTMVEVSEGSTATVAIRLSAQPTGTLTVNASSGSTLAATVAAASVTFSDTNWNIDQTVTVTGVEDANTANEQTTLNLSGAGLVAVALPLTIVDNDILGIQVSTTNVGSIAEGSTTTTFTAQLTQMPATDVTVNVGSTNSSVATVAPAVLTFTSATWNVPQVVTVGAPHDLDTINAATTISLMATGLVSRTISVSVTDDDVQAIVATPNPVAVDEGAAGTFAVRLAFAPAATVTVNVSSLNGTIATATPATLTFTPTNYATPQNVTVMGLQDPDASNTPTTIRLEDAATGLLTNVPVTVVDDEQLLIEISTSSVALGEAGSTTFDVRLSAMPPGNVTVNVSSGNASSATVSPPTLTFTTASYNTFQTITVAGVQDVNLENEVIVLTLSAPDFTPQTVTANVTDDDVQAVVVSSATSTVPEGGSGTIGVSLMFQPATTVTVTVMSSSTSVATVAPATLTFTTTNYAFPQNITISGVQDANTVNGTTTIALTAPSATPASVGVTVTDDDTLAIQAEVAGVTVTESGTGPLRIRLSAEPAANTTVMIASTNPLAATAAPASLSFTTANWMTFQDVTITGVEDANTLDDTSTAILSSTGLANVNVALTVVDNDTQAIVASTGSVALAENGTTTFGVHLGAMPAGNVVVNVSSGDPGAATVSGALTFTTANYGVDQLVTVTGVQDTDLLNEAVVITLSSTGLANRLVTANVTEDDTQAVIVSQPSLTIGEGQIGGFSVALAFQPATNVTVSLSSSNPSVASVAPAMLTFTPGNYSVTQNLTLTALHDPDSVNGATTISATAPGATSGSVAVTVIDDDLVQIVIDQPQMWVYEKGPPRTFNVQLSAQPAAPLNVAVMSMNLALASPSPQMLTFTTTNWNVPQPVQVIGGDDEDVLHQNVRIDLTSPGLTTQTVRVDVIDDDLLVVDPVYIDTCHGQTSLARITLRGPPFPGPPHNGRLDVNVYPGTYVQPSPVLFMFNMVSFGMPQNVMLPSPPNGFTAVDVVRIDALGQRPIQIDFLLRPTLACP